MIRFDRVSKTYPGRDGGPVHAVRELELEVRAGETLCLIGPSGCGKTSTLRLVNGMLEPDEGRVLVAGEDVRDREPHRLRRGMGYVVQSGALFPHLTVGENVGLLCRLEGWSKGDTRARVEELLEVVHLAPDEFAGRYPGELSGGQRQRVGVARALALDPPLLLMDEPFGALDPLTRASIQTEFLELSERVEKTILLVTHDLQEAFLLGDRVALFDAGRMAQVGTEDELLHAPANEQVKNFVEGHRNGS